MTQSLFDRITLALDPPSLDDPTNSDRPGPRPGAGRAPAPVLRVVGQGALPSRFDVTGLAVASIAAAGLEIARLVGAAAGSEGAGRWIEVDRRLASFWFGFSIRPVGWSLPSPWDPIAGDYPTREGWIRLHTNAPHHRAAALRVLGVEGEKSAVAAAVARLEGDSLESAIVAAGGCAARMRSIDDWLVHPQGRAVRSEPLIAWRTSAGDGPRASSRERAPEVSPAPLAGIRVLDLTRVLAGPVATRWLAAFGAEVLRIDPPDWDEPGVVPEVTLGKRCAALDLRRSADRERFGVLLAGADVLIHGYRPGALDGLGLDEAAIRARRPDLVEVSLSAYGGSGPWKERRGFDSLVQMSCGLADAGMSFAGADRPVPLPVQALDHATGYLMAAAAIRGLRLRGERGLVTTARLSLARTAELLIEAGTAPASAEAGRPLAPESVDDLDARLEATDWGPARRVRFPLRVDGTRADFAGPARALRSEPAAWREPALHSNWLQTSS